MAGRNSALWFFLLAIGIWMGGCNVSARAPAEISTSVIHTSFHDMEGQIEGLAPCAWTAHRSQGFGAKKINFVITINAQGDYGKLDRYFYKDSSGALLPADAGQIARFKEGLKKCFKAALDAGFSTLHVLPHVDPVNKDGQGMWRNVVKFDPLQKIGPAGSQFSYEDVLLRPAAEAVNAVVGYGTGVELTLAGEQGLSVFTYPNSWAQLLGRTKAASSQGKDASKHHVGVSFNWDKVCGCVEPEERDPIKYNTTYLERFARFKAAGGLRTVDVAGVRNLLEKSDFIGTSGYASTDQNVVAASHEVSARTVNFELAPFGIDLRYYMFNLNKPFVYSEQGLGGCQSNGQVSPNVPYVAKHPFWGIWPWQYEKGLDPWQHEDFKAYRRKFYQALSQFAQAGGGPQYRVDGIFVWSVGSWDVHGVHPVSTSSQGTFRDEEIVSYIKTANAAANGGARAAAGRAAPAAAAAPTAAAARNVALTQQEMLRLARAYRGDAPGASGGATGNVATGPAYVG